MTASEEPPFPTLQTERLVLRELKYADAPALLAEFSDAVAMQYMGRDPLKDLEAACFLIGRFAAERSGAAPTPRWALERKVDGELIGTCGVFAWNKLWQKCSVGYDLHASAWGQGYMTEALHAVFRWAFESLSLHRIEAIIHPDNTASLKLAARFGFVVEGRMREVASWGGTHHDMLMLGLLKRDFEMQMQQLAQLQPSLIS